jgi:hypothetical protein
MARRSNPQNGQLELAPQMIWHGGFVAQVPSGREALCAHQQALVFMFGAASQACGGDIDDPSGTAGSSATGDTPWAGAATSAGSGTSGSGGMLARPAAARALADRPARQRPTVAGRRQ